MTEKKPVEMTICPWGCGEVPKKEYSEHLMKHYKKKGEKMWGPYPDIKKEE